MTPDDRRLAKWTRETLFFDVEDSTHDDDAERHRVRAGAFYEYTTSQARRAA